MKKRLMCMLLILLLCLTLFPAAQASDIIFIAVNDTIPFSLNVASMPFYSGDVLYLPYSVFDQPALGIVPTYHPSDRTLKLSSQTDSLLFDYEGGSYTTEAGERIPLLIRYSVPFIPADFCCSYFGLGISYLTSLGGYSVIRLKSGSEVYSDSLFLEKAENLIAYRVSEYLPAETTNPNEPSVPVSPLPPATPEESDKPTPPVSPDPSENTEDAKPPEEAEETYLLAICGVSDKLLDFLEAQHQQAAILVTPAELRSTDVPISRLLANGYTVGIDVSSSEQPEQDLETANAELQRHYCCKTLLALVPNGCAEALHELGWCAFEADNPAIMLLLSGDVPEELLTLRQSDAILTSLHETNLP